MQRHHFSRRTFLRGLGVTVALPWMESLRVWGDESKSANAASEAPIRYLRDLLGQWLSLERVVGQRRRPRHGSGTSPRAPRQTSARS